MTRRVSIGHKDRNNSRLSADPVQIVQSYRQYDNHLPQSHRNDQFVTSYTGRLTVVIFSAFARGAGDDVELVTLTDQAPAVVLQTGPGLPVEGWRLGNNVGKNERSPVFVGRTVPIIRRAQVTPIETGVRVVAVLSYVPAGRQQRLGNKATSVAGSRSLPGAAQMPAAPLRRPGSWPYQWRCYKIVSALSG